MGGGDRLHRQAGPMRLTPRLAETPEDVEALRLLRNECREWMTGSRAEITPEQQAAWWPDHVGTAWLYDLDGCTVGFSYVRPAPDEQIWATVGLTVGARGKGFGAGLYRHVALASPCRVRAAIRGDNVASIGACRRAGWHLIYGDSEAVDFVSPLGWQERAGP